jgi:hypothetical protein
MLGHREQDLAAVRSIIAVHSLGNGEPPTIVDVTSADTLPPSLPALTFNVLPADPPVSFGDVRVFRAESADGKDNLVVREVHALTSTSLRDANHGQGLATHGLLLLTPSIIFVWLGALSVNSRFERALVRTGVEYGEAVGGGRRVVRLAQGAESVDFRSWVPALDADPATAQEEETAETALSFFDKVHPLSALLDASALPRGVDREAREASLAPDDFPDAFGMTKEEFDALPEWKANQVKASSPLH